MNLHETLEWLARMPLWKRVLVVCFAILMPFVGSLDKIAW